MGSTTERSSSSRSTTPLMPGRIVIAFDATRNRSIQDLKCIITNIRMRGDMIQEADTITVFGVLHKVLHPMGFQIQVGLETSVGTHIRAIKEEVSRKIDACVGMLQHSAEEYENEEVDIEVKIAVGAPIEKVVVQEIVSSNATWAILDRQLRKELRFYLKHTPCKVALVQDNLSLEVRRPYYSDKSTDVINHKLLYSLSKPVLISRAQDIESDNHSVISVISQSVSSPGSSDIPKTNLVSSSTSYSKEQESFSQDEFESNPLHEISGDSYGELESECDDSPQVMQKQKGLENHSEVPSLRCASEMKMEQISMGCNYSEMQIATDDFSNHNLLGKGGFGAVYRGQLADGKLITVKVQTEANAQGFSEFKSELDILSFARHKNIVMLLGYCCKDELNILVYEYICNKSLEWHLFDNTENVLEWHQRHAIAIGAAKGLRFLHEECRGSPIIHRDIRLSNILLTHDFVPLLGDSGLAKWKTKKQTRILGNLAYLAPEYRENGICSVKTDVYAFGIVLIQLISGRKEVESARDNHQQSLRHWALPLIRTLAFDELVDPRLGDLYSTYQLYQLARAAHLCIQTKPAMRPTMGEVLRLVEGENDLQCHLTEKLTPHHVVEKIRTLQCPFLGGLSP